MPRNTSKTELKNDVLSGMRRYLGHHPELAFQTAIDLTALVVERSSSKALLEWRDRLVDLDKHGSDGDLVYPNVRKSAKRTLKRKRPTRKA
jgi:hypothetical protein